MGRWEGGGDSTFPRILIGQRVREEREIRRKRSQVGRRVKEKNYLIKEDSLKKKSPD
jgi:hypothetical protein